MQKFVRFQFNCDRLWKLWYSILIILMQVSLICLAISKYLTYKSQALDPRFGNKWSSLPLNFQLSAIVLSLALLVWLIYSCMFKVGHIANDGIVLGLDLDSIKKALEEIASQKGIKLFMARLITHALPYNCFIHLFIALLLCVPVALMQAEQIKNEAISPDYIWTTNIDFLINPHSFRMFKADSVICYKAPCEYPTNPTPISPEFMNLIISLMIIIIRLPSPFWYTNKAFSILFSIFAFITASCIFMEYESLILIIKIIHNYDFNTTTESHLSVWLILIIFLVKSLLMIFMLIIVFEYGYTQFISNMRKYRQYFSSDISDSVSQQSLNDNHYRWYNVSPRICGIVILIIVKVLKIPILYVQILYLKFNGKVSIHPLIFISICISLFYCLSCLFLWFGLCVKNKWQFHINIQTNPLPQMGIGKLNSSPEPVYGCFYNAPSGSSQTSISKPMLRSSIDGSDSSNHRMNQSANYVLLHSGMNPAMRVMPINENQEFHAGESEVSFDSNSKSYDSGDNKYKRIPFGIQSMENSQYATLASLQSGVLLTPKSVSDTSSNENYPKINSRRGSNRVTFKEENNTINLNYPTAYSLNYLNNSPASRIPDILSMNNNEKQGPFEYPCNPHGFDTDLEMSTDMRQCENLKGKDPRLCSQV